MSLLIGNSRRRKFLLATIAIAAGGYVSYRLYNSSAFARKRRRLLQILSTMSLCFDAVSDSAESLSILSRDLKAFLLSDDDSVPQSLRQAFKIGQCAEFEGTVTVLSAAFACGLLGASAVKGRKQVQGYARGQGQPVKSCYQSLHVKEDTTCREIREVCFTPQSVISGESVPSPNVERGRCQEWEVKSFSSGADVCPRKSGTVLDRSKRGQKECKCTEDLPDRLLSKLFSEPGVGFTSAVAGALARNLVLAFFDGVHNQSSAHLDAGSSSQTSACNDTSDLSEKTSRILDVLCTNSCRMLIAHCIQTFISTAVTVYIDKTKDVNFYNDMVAGITNPSHKDQMKDIMTSVCNGAIETFVKTTYDVMFAKQDGQNKSWEIQECIPFLSSPSEEDVNASEDPQSHASATAARAYEQINVGGVQTFIDGVSKTLAIPSNHKLVVDVAGTMTSEAVRSFVDVVTSTVSTRVQQSWEKVKRNVSASNQGLQLQERSKMAAKAVVLASVCLAIWLHILMGVQLLQKSPTSILLGR